MEVLGRIADTLKAKGGDALIASDLKDAAMARVFGFEILPAPFVVSHLQLGLLLHRQMKRPSRIVDEAFALFAVGPVAGWPARSRPLAEHSSPISSHQGVQLLGKKFFALMYEEPPTPLLIYEVGS